MAESRAGQARADGPRLHSSAPAGRVKPGTDSTQEGETSHEDR